MADRWTWPCFLAYMGCVGMFIAFREHAYLAAVAVMLFVDHLKSATSIQMHAPPGYTFRVLQCEDGTNVAVSVPVRASEPQSEAR